MGVFRSLKKLKQSSSNRASRSKPVGASKLSNNSRRSSKIERMTAPPEAVAPSTGPSVKRLKRKFF